MNADGDCNAAIALIDKGEINCCGGNLGQPGLFEETEKEKEPELTPEEIAAAEAQRKAEEEEKRLKEEEERKRQEEEKRLKEEEERKRKKKEKWARLRKSVSNFFGNLVKENDND